MGTLGVNLRMTECSTHTFPGHFFADPVSSCLAVLLGETQTGLDLLGRLESKRESRRMGSMSGMQIGNYVRIRR
jgi:hypothetical protein